MLSSRNLGNAAPMLFFTLALIAVGITVAVVLPRKSNYFDDLEELEEK
tara:strand:- start:1715 stop:1858 length:144 start_codon:yes stop_codon:yes gene_type:complete